MTLREFLSKCLSALRRRQLDRDLDTEITQHIELARAEHMRRGANPEEAARLAAIRFGSISSAREQVWDERRVPGLGSFLQDARYALRAMRRSPGFTFVAVATLALGIGLCSMAYTILNGAFLQPLPAVPDPERLAAIETPVSFPRFVEYRDHSNIAQSMAAFIGPAPCSVAIGDAPAERLNGHIVSREYFSTLGIAPTVGRFFSDEPAGAAPTVVLSERFWRARLHADSRAIGSAIRVNGARAIIAGVAPKDFPGAFPLANPADIYLPVTADPRIAPELSGDALESAVPRFRVLIRLAHGVSMRAAEARLDAQARLLEETPPRDKKARLVHLLAAGGLIAVPEEARVMMVVFYGLLVALLLTLTSANLGGLILARGAARSREIAIRLSIGANRARLIRQLVTESLVLAAIGGVAAVGTVKALFFAIDRWLAFTDPGALPPNTTWRPDYHVVAFTFLISALAGLGFGLLPAFAVTRPALANALKTGVSVSTPARRRFGLRNLFVVYQMTAAMMLMLIMGAGVLGITHATNQPPGFDVTPLYLFSVDPARDGLTLAESTALVSGIREKLAGIRSIESVSIANQAPLIPAINNVDATGDRTARVAVQLAGPRYFATLGVPLIRGVEFTDRDFNPGPILPAVINQTAARALFSGDPLGREIQQDKRIFQVIGVADFDQPQIFANKPLAAVFIPFTAKDAWRSAAQGVTVIVRARGPFEMSTLRNAIDPRVTIFHQQTMRDSIDEIVRGVRFATGSYGFIGVFGLVLTCVGLAGVTAQTVERRRKEIGIRMALGARKSQLLALVIREGATMVAIGAVIGAVGAYAAGRILSALWAPLAQIIDGSNSPMLSAGIPALLVALAMIACYLPARRSSGIDPLIALREE
jgi:macrolide transport system ATP-binding/permease protein